MTVIARGTVSPSLIYGNFYCDGDIKARGAWFKDGDVKALGDASLVDDGEYMSQPNRGNIEPGSRHRLLASSSVGGDVVANTVYTRNAFIYGVVRGHSVDMAKTQCRGAVIDGGMNTTLRSTKAQFVVVNTQPQNDPHPPAAPPPPAGLRAWVARNVFRIKPEVPDGLIHPQLVLTDCTVGQVYLLDPKAVLIQTYPCEVIRGAAAEKAIAGMLFPDYLSRDEFNEAASARGADTYR